MTKQTLAAEHDAFFSGRFQSRFHIGVLAVVLLLTACGNENNGSDSSDSNGTPSERALWPGRLNDTGITLFANATSNTEIAAVADFPGQDADVGRDVSAANDADGHAGFQFAKLAADTGAETTADPWGCVYDKTTGLTWEVKTNLGARGGQWTFTWYNPDDATNGGDAGVQNGGICTDISCDTAAYVQYINDINLCGKNDWRLPTREELRTLLDYSVPDTSPRQAKIDANFFPNTAAGDYWTLHTFVDPSDANASQKAWEIHFDHARSEPHDKGATNVYVRLVRRD